MPQPLARDRFLDLLRVAVRDETLTKLTLGKYRGNDATVKNLFVRPVSLKEGLHLGFVWRHATRDITKNYTPAVAVTELERLIGGDFLDAHLFSATQNAQLETQPDGSARIKVTAPVAIEGDGTLSRPGTAHNRAKSHLISADAGWLRSLGVTDEHAQPAKGQADKFRQIQKFAELLSHLIEETPLPSDRRIAVVDMGAGKGYLTFAVAALLGERAQVRGIEVRPELVALCNRVAAEEGFAPRLNFVAGAIANTPLNQCDVLIALHACDTATDDAISMGIAAGAQLIVVSPCCQKELRAQLTAPAVLADALRHGIFQERQAEFVTDSMRAQLLEWSGYRTKVFEFISTEHTAKNLMIAAIKAHPPHDASRAERLRAFAAFYGIRHQRLAQHLGFSFSPGT